MGKDVESGHLSTTVYSNVVDSLPLQALPSTRDSMTSFEKLRSPAQMSQKDQNGLMDDPVKNPQEIRGCSIWLLVILSLPRMSINMAWAAQWAALGPYLGTMLPKFAVQLTQIIGPMSGVLVAPTIGVLSDRCTLKWGRRRPFLLFGAVTSVICWILMGYTREFGEALGDHGEKHRTWTSVLTILFYAWMDITVNLTQTPAFLIIADFAGERQTTGAAIGQASSTLGSIVVAGYISIFGAAHETLHYFLGMLSVTMLVTVGIVCIVAKETPLEKSADDVSSTSQRILDAFKSIILGLKMLPKNLIVYCFIFFCVQYGYTAYNGSKGQFFGLGILNGTAEGADKCGENCSIEQKEYNRGVHIAGGNTDLIFAAIGYFYSLIIPYLVHFFGTKWVVTFSIVPQCFLMILAFVKSISLGVFFVILTTFTQSTIFAMLVPVIIHEFGEKDVGMYVGALNSANCFGQLLNFIIGSALVETSMGYALPVFVGGAVSLIGLLVSLFVFKMQMYSM